ncbi:TetR/AcrR family transcriptional regulator [Skermanella stibiiresistens]|nr:TetR/AcrR family transcriptional regulator [Skermanella stibiiresistens]
MTMTATRDPRPEIPSGPKPAQILSAAKTLFTSQGFGATSMDAIAKMANVSKATLYAHFSGKEELFAAIVSHECRSQQPALWAPGVEDKDVADALTEIGRNFLGLLLSAPAVAIFRVVIAESARFPELGRIFFNSGPNQVRQSLSSYLARASARGRLDIRDSWRAGEHFIGMLQTPVHLDVLFGVKDGFTRDELDRIVRDAVDTFLRAYLPRDRTAMA